METVPYHGSSGGRSIAPTAISEMTVASPPSDGEEPIAAMAIMPYHGSRHPSSTASMMESLPIDIMIKVLEFVELPTRVLLAGCSKTLQKLVFKQCKPLWVHIDFGEGTALIRQRLTDGMLASLLVRVDARDITTSLSMSFRAPHVEGIGLAPLSMSRVLENVRVDIPWLHAISILRTMIPFKLSHVRFGDRSLIYNYRYYCSNLLAFHRDLSAATFQRARIQQMVCSTCEGTVVEDSLQLVPKRMGFRSSRCDTCHNHFCRRGCCSTGVSDCMDCGDTSCDSCAKVKTCVECARSYCDSCQKVTLCESCSEEYCGSCGEFASCDLCQDKICEACNDGADVPILWCQRCHKRFCGDCRVVDWCDACEAHICEDCAQVQECDRCNNSFCVFCSETNYIKCCGQTVCLTCEVPVKCHSCPAKFCSEAISKCASCSFEFCSDCREVSHCETCVKDYCSECCQVSSFDCCDGKAMCGECMAPNQSCDGCVRTNCTLHMSTCDGPCETTSCDDCALLRKCDMCSKGFCADCLELITFDCCNKTACSECMPPQQACVGCTKTICKEHIKMCSECKQSFCSCCRDMSPCGNCGLCYCNDDCAFTDHCEQCETTYCEDCAIVVRCAFCGHSTCEQCRRKSGGFCVQCNEKPKKKARTSSTTRRRRS